MGKRIIVSILIALSFLYLFVPKVSADDSMSKYGIIIADKNGKYTFYDLNALDNKAGIELSEEGNVMVPLKRLVKLMPDLEYKYNSKTKEATVSNKYNSRSIVFKRNSDLIKYYKSKSAKVSKKTMTYKMYVSPNSSSVMVHMSSLKWVMGSNGGYQYIKKANMSEYGYDTSLYSGLIIYNPYKKVDKVPLASNVNGISHTVKVTIPEGYSMAQAFELLVSKGISKSTEELFKIVEEYDFSYYPLVADINRSEHRSFFLEGYLYPDTYEFYRLSKPQDVIGKFLRNMESKMTDEYKARAKELGYTMDEILIIASLIEKEVGDKTIMPLVSSVIHNRLNTNKKLQLDASIYYVERYIKPYIDGDVNRYNEYYNTYKCDALPAGPISNPGRNAILAALYPEETDYLFFYSDKDGEYHFSATYVNPKDMEENEAVVEDVLDSGLDSVGDNK